MNCPRCDKEVSENDNYCKNCGHNLSFAEKPQREKKSGFKPNWTKNNIIFSQDGKFSAFVRNLLVVIIAVILLISFVLMIFIYIKDTKASNQSSPIYYYTSSENNYISSIDDRDLDFPEMPKSGPDKFLKLTVGKEFAPGEYLVVPKQEYDCIIIEPNGEETIIDCTKYITLKKGDVVQYKNVKFEKGVKQTVEFGKEISGQFKVGFDIPAGYYFISGVSETSAFNINTTNVIDTSKTRSANKKKKIRVKNGEYLTLYHVIITKDK